MEGGLNMTKDGDSYILDECPFIPGMGTINASGVLRNLNGSKLSLTEIFLRESVQNSFDARLKTKGQEALRFQMRAFHFSEAEYRNLDTLLKGEDSPFSYYSMNVKKYLSPDMVNIEVEDLNTSGLIGGYEPTAKVGGQNFTNFVYFTGNDKKKETTAGGSYGFGKAALFAYSKARTIAVYTRIQEGNYFQSRFIVISSDERIKESNSDRCWWGEKTYFSKKDRGVYAAPIIGDDADDIAESIGFSKFDRKQTGTKILVLNAGPEDDQLPEDEYGNKKDIIAIFKDDLPKYIVHWYWNNILSVNNKIEFSLKYENEDIAIDNPDKVVPYKQFASAYRRYLANLRENKLSDTSNFKVIKCQKPQVTLGYFSYVTTPVMEARYKNLIDVFKTSEPVVAYMRGIGHIVYYDTVHINSDSIETTCYGVFKTDSKAAPSGVSAGAIDRYFRSVENQTHDKWEHQREKDGKYNYVKMVEDDIQDTVKNHCIHATEEQKSSDISVVIQRTLGEKLMPYLSPIGGAKNPLKDKGKEKDKVKKSQISSTGVTNYSIEKNKKYVSVEYKANLVEGKKIRINGVDLRIKTIDDTDEILEDSDVISFYQIIIKEKNGARIFVKKAFESGTCILEKNHNFFIKLECKKDCAFDIKINWEEINE